MCGYHIKKLHFILIFILAITLSSDTKLQAVQQAAQVSQWGITWTFDHDYTVGQFVNGDWWVLDDGSGVTVANVSPGWDGVKHGSMLDPVVPGPQGYDNKVRHSGCTKPGTRAGLMSFRDSVRTTFPKTISAAGVTAKSLVSTIGLDQVSCGGAYPILDTAAVLTVVENTPPVNAFRPNYISSPKKIYTTSDADYSKVPLLPVPSGVTLPASNIMQRVWLDHGGPGSVSGATIHPISNMKPYPRDSSVQVSNQTLLLMLDLPEREEYINRLVQLGIDLYPISLRNEKGFFTGGGGFGSGRKWPILFAGILLNDLDIQTPPLYYEFGAPYPTHKFMEDADTYYGKPVTTPDAFGNVYPNGKPLFGEITDATCFYGNLCQSTGGGAKDCRDLNGLQDACGYRVCCSSHTWVGQALAAHLMNAEDIWNWPAFFDYVDRWVDEGGSSGSSFISDMWNTYRDGLGDPDDIPPNPPSSLISTNQTENTITLAWTAPQPAEDNDLASYYRIFRNGNQIVQTSATSYQDSGLTGNTSYNYEVYSVDNAVNQSTSATSGTFTTLADINPPAIETVWAEINSVMVVFDEPIQSSLAQNINNYSISNGISISSVSLGSDLATVTLTTSSHTEDINYTLTIANISDPAGNVMSQSQLIYQFENAINSSPSTWQNQPITPQTDNFTVEYDAIALADNIDGVIGFSNQEAAGYSDLAIIIRFNTSGTIDARNGSTYSAETNVPYNSGTLYHFRLEVNLATHSYNVYVTPAGSSEVVLGTSYAFRTEQNTVSELNNIALAPGDPYQIKNIQFSPLTVNQAPVLSNIGNQVVTESSPLTFTVNATDPDGDTITYSAQNLPTGATFVGQTFSWTPTAADAGSYSVTFTASDGTSQDSETMTITVSSSASTNQSPDAVNDTISTIKNNAVITGNVLANDTDPDGDTLSITSFTSTGNGTIDNNGNGTFTYTPNANFTGTDTFTYTISDGNTGTDTATVTITVNNEAPAPDLVLYMELTNDNPADGVDDSSSYNNDGTINGNVSLTTDRNGNANSAYNFDGSGDLVSIPHSSSFDTDTVTVAAWIYQNEAGDDRVVCKASGTAIADHIFSLGVVNTAANQSVVRTRLATDSGSYSFDSTTTFSTNTWNHLAFTYDGQSVHIFINGVERDTFNATGLLQKTSIPVVIGNVDLINNRYFSGKIDDVKVYNYALSAANIASLASEGSSTNSPPILASIGNKTTNENVDLIFSISATDSDGDTVSYSVTGLPTGAQFANQAFTWTPTYTQAGDNYQVTFIANDGTAQTSETISITVANVNRPPILTSISDQQATMNTPLYLTVLATDPDSDIINYSVQNLPAGATFENQVFSWTPDATANETNTITFSASDGQDQDFQTITIIVGSINQPPVLDPIGDQTVEELSSLSFTLNATDTDGDILSFSANNLPTGATFIDQVFSWTPTQDQAGTYQSTFIVSDNEEIDFETIIITVNNVNRAPVIATIEPIAQLESTPINFIVSATDADEDVLSYSVEGLDLLTGATFENQIFDWTPGFESAGNYLLTFNVTDGQNSVSQEVAITILNDNRPPVFDPIENQVIKVGDTLIFEISASDPDGNPITYSAQSLPGDATLTQTANGATFSWNTQGHELGSHPVTFIATDGQDMAYETITVDVVEGNLKPKFVPLDPQTGQEDSEILFTVSATDENNDPLTYSAQNLPTGSSFVDQTFTWTPDFNAAGEYPITFVVSDGLLEDFMIVPLIVQNTNRPPAFQPLNDILADDTEQIQLDLPATDPDGDTLTYSVQGVLPGTSTLIASTFSWALEYGDSGTYPITFVISDGDLEATTAAIITINHVNLPPTINVMPDQFVNQYSSLTFPITATDLENDPVVITVQNLPTGATYTNDLLNWTPGDSQDGTTQIVIEASDGKLTSSTTVTIFVMTITLDTTPPLVSYTSPEDQAIQVPLNTLMVMEVADSGDGIDANTVVIQADGQDIYRGNVTEYSSSQGKMHRYGNPAIYKYTFQPTEMFRSDQKVELTLNAKDLRGNAMPAHTFSFSTEMMTFGGITPVNIPNDGQPQSHPISTLDALGNLWVAWQSGSAGTGRIIVTQLLAGKTTFENTVQLPATGDQANPAIATDSNGKAYLCWQEQRQGIWNIYAATSTDGINWSTPLQLAPSDENQSNPTIATNPLAPGSVYIAYQQESSNVQDIHLVSSTNELGNTTLTAITNLSTQQINPDVVVANGVAYLIWTDLRHPTTSIYGASSDNNWLNIPIVNQTSNQSQPDLASENNGATLHLVWTDDQSGSQDIFYASSSNGFSDAPLTGTSLIDDTTNRNQFNARLTTTGTGNTTRVFVGWQDERNSPVDSDIYFVDLSASSGTNILVTTDTSKTNQSSPALGVNAIGDPYLLWVDARGPDDDIYYGGVTNISGVQMAAAEVTQQDGGVVGTSFENIASADDVSVEVPADALWSDVTLSITKVSNPTQTSDISSVISAYEFSPSSELEFAKPVTITIPYEVADNQIADVYWYDSLTGELSQSGMTGIEAIQISSNLWAIRFQTTHFSQYMIGQQPTTKTKGKGSGNKPKK